MSANKKLLMPADFRGLKMRIQSSKVLEAQMRALGAIPQVMAFSEVYQALATGVVDGTENPPSNEYTQKMHEVQKYTTRSGHGYVGYAVITNKKFWDGLPADVRSSLEKAMKEATDFANGVAQKDNDDAIEAMKKSGKTEMVELTAEQKAAWRKALEPVTPRWKAASARKSWPSSRRKPAAAPRTRFFRMPCRSVASPIGRGRRQRRVRDPTPARPTSPAGEGVTLPIARFNCTEFA